MKTKLTILIVALAAFFYACTDFATINEYNTRYYSSANDTEYAYAFPGTYLAKERVCSRDSIEIEDTTSYVIIIGTNKVTYVSDTLNAKHIGLLDIYSTVDHVDSTYTWYNSNQWEVRLFERDNSIDIRDGACYIHYELVENED